MEDSDLIEVRSAVHPRADIARAGLPLHHPYVEQCITPALGPSSIALLRTMPRLWADSDPVVIRADELAQTIGMKARHLSDTIKRLHRWGYAEPTAADQLTVYTRCRPLSPRSLQRLPERVQEAHTRLLADHLRDLTRAAPSSPTVAAAAQFAQRLDHLQARSAAGVEISR